MVMFGIGITHRIQVVGATFILIFFLIFTLRFCLAQQVQNPDQLRPGHESLSTHSNGTPNDNDQEPQEKSLPSEEQSPVTQISDLPADYTKPRTDQPFCEERFGVAYLENLGDAAIGYCTPDSSSSLTCFHSQTTDSSRVDSFCIGEGAFLDPETHKFRLGCELDQPKPHKAPFHIPEYDQLETYWYETGPGVVFDKFVELDTGRKELTSPSSDSFVLVKREGPSNVWHCLMEILSMTFSLDVLRMSSKSGKKGPYLPTENLENTQVVLLDDAEDGPFIGLWNLVVGRPVIRLKDIPPSSQPHTIIVPLPGGSNPMWQGDWVPHSCDHSMLLQTFTRRVLGLYNLESSPSRQDPNIVLTYINRTSSRRLIDDELYLNKVKEALPHITVRSVDFATLSLQEQLKIVQETDVLVGVHGAGLTHGMFMQPRSTIVELLPSDLNHKGFRNMAMLMDHAYLSVHSSPKSKTGNDWHGEDVFVEFDKFLEIVTIAVKGMYNRGGRNYDVR